MTKYVLSNNENPQYLKIDARCTGDAALVALKTLGFDLLVVCEPVMVEEK